MPLTQNQKIMEWLRRNGSITPKDAMIYLQIYRLAARIKELRATLGQDVIETTTEGERGTKYARYVYHGD